MRPHHHQTMALKYRVAFLGFTEFERTALGSYFRLANREPRYVQVQMLTDADFLVADADHGPSVQLVVATDRVAEAVFIGSQAPPGAVAWMTRPIDALHVMRELDAMVTVARAGASEHAAGGTRVVPRRRPPQLPQERRLPPLSAAPAAPSAEGVAGDELPPLHLRQDLRPPASESLLERAAATLPVAPFVSPSAAAARRAAALAAPALPGRQPPQPPRALVVDDSAIAQRYLEIRLLRCGLVVDRADHSARANDLMLRHSYDLVFLDVELGPNSELDGLALCQQIKHSVSAMNVTVVMVSAHHTELDRVRGALAGCDAYLAKPLDQAELDRLLQRQGFAPANKAGPKNKRAAASP